MEATTVAILYEPEWNAEKEKYEDINPFIKGERGNKHEYLCKCRNERGDLLTSWTHFNNHFDRTYHKTWRRRFGKVANEEILRLRLENIELKKEKAILHVELEKYIAQSKKNREKYERSQEKYNELKKGAVYRLQELD